MSELLQEPVPVTQLVRETATVMQEFSSLNQGKYIWRSIWLLPPILLSTGLRRMLKQNSKHKLDY